jgi:hypothetical protein
MHVFLTFVPIIHINFLSVSTYVSSSAIVLIKKATNAIIESGCMYISRDVVFHEDWFPFAAASSPTEPPTSLPAPFIPPLHLLAPAHTRPALPSTSSHTIPTSSHVSQSSFVEPSVTISNSSTPTPPTRIHPIAHKGPQ